MNGKIKLLWIGDSPAVTTGFGRVSQGVLEGLYQTGRYDIAVLGINHSIGDPHPYEGMFRIYPASAKGNIYGFNRVAEVIEKENPDIIIINNDLWIVSEYVKFIPENNRIFTYSPVDALPVHVNWLDSIIKVNARFGSYTEFAKKGMLAVKPNLNIEIIGHGVDTSEFYRIEDARKFMANIPDDVFVVQTVNRNQPRKRIDLYLKAMRLWLDRKSSSERNNIAFYYHGCLRDVGWNLVDLAQRWGIDDRLLVTDQTDLTPAKGVSLSALCKIYNCADVHVMTSMGEGFGLSPFESAACGVAQVVPDHSAPKELWEGIAPLIKISEWEVLTGGINTEGGVIDIEHLAEILEDLYQHRDKVKAIGKAAFDYVQREEFTWEYISKKFDTVIMKMLGSDSTLSKKFSKEQAKGETLLDAGEVTKEEIVNKNDNPVPNH